MSLSPIITSDTIWSPETFSNSQIDFLEKIIDQKIEKIFGEKLEEMFGNLEQIIQSKLDDILKKKIDKLRKKEETNIPKEINIPIERNIKPKGRKPKNKVNTVAVKVKKKRGRKPSAFIIQSRISDDLAKFLNVPLNTLMARTDVTRRICEYISNNRLQDPNDRRIIIPDQKLSELLKYDNNSKLSYFNLQMFLKKHIV